MIQTRSETTGLCECVSMKEALDKANKNETIWIISFSLGNERIILDKTLDGTWALRE